MFKTKTVLGAVAATVLSLGSATAVVAQSAAAEQTASETVLYEGAWTKKTFKSSGTWSIVESADGKQYVKLSGDFKTRNAPDLKIFLSPQDAADTTGANATDGAVLVSPLSSNRGAQTYELPAGVDAASYASILIHCEQFSKLWSAADLG